eukprot:gnl/MRDRNA2_/MRDRNA2_211250_c0_seq1.p1 gnl/MRDRNA2_/MRDRNA2_211250_c0~~gnl/MRDRNA2_/MRDRNA2_211250_c0_seq1.p1  ORF type:complete len:327 (+),score=61.02 gnl/MRDRNA2_/MRDRNA2_211250_c0_seq1:2-982(+)
MGPNEHVLQAAKRCLIEKLGLKPGELSLPGQLGLLEGIITFNEQSILSMDADHESEEMSLRFPGLPTMVRKMVVQATLMPASEASKGVMISRGVAAQQRGFDHVTPKNHQYFWRWKPIVEVPAFIRLRSRLYQGLSLDDVVKNSRASVRKFLYRQTKVVLTDDHVHIETPWLKGQIEEMLSERGTPPDALRDLWGISVEELWDQAAHGQVIFGVCKSKGKVLIFKDIVLLRIVSARSNAVLAQVTDKGVQWLQTQRLLHESIWCAARRLARQQLGLEDGSLRIGFRTWPSSDTSQCEGILERRWLATALIPQALEHLCSEIHASEV